MDVARRTGIPNHTERSLEVLATGMDDAGTMSRKQIVRREVANIEGDWPAHWPEELKRVHAARGSASANDAMPRLADLPPPDDMLGIAEAVALLADAIVRDQRIVVTADFDCDGATACAVAVRGLRMLGARNVQFAVPDRVVHGYGLTPALVEHIAPMQPDVLITVDHGIACHAGVAAAKACGWQVIVTDHHLPGQTLPPADAIVDPNQPGDEFPGKSLAGVGVLFYVLLALRKCLREAGSEAASHADLSTLLDLVAVGTVADMVPLDRINRALIGAGLRRLRAGQGCAGLRALIEVSGKRAQTLTTADIGYGIAPRINAAGRLEDMTLGIECLLSDDPAHARQLAEALHHINGERRALQDDMVDAAVANVDVLREPLPLAVCLHDEHWHAGVVGLVASKMKERLHRPVVAFAPSGANDGFLRGSARSIPGLHMRDAIALVDARHPGLIERFGGHAMAAGMTLAEAHRGMFEAAFLSVVEAWMDPASLDEHIESDGELERHDIQLACALRDGGHWGQRYPEPLFDGVFEVSSTRIVSERHLRMELANADGTFNAMHFGGANDDMPVRGDYIHIAYRLVPDDWRGGEAVQLIVVHREPTSGSFN